MSIKPSSSKGKKKSKEKVFQIQSSSEEVSEDFEKDESQSPRKKKPKTSIQKRNKQKRQDNYEMELEDKVQRKDPDVNQKVEEIIKEGFNQRVGGMLNKSLVEMFPIMNRTMLVRKSPLQILLLRV